ncbi:MAG TPA: AsmA family protein [Candidatus Angelobacter sp.]
MIKSTRGKIIVAFLVLLALAIFLPPNINGTRFKKGLAGSLSAALGREVKIGEVKYRIFPRPGFDIYNLQVMDDPQFSAEPLILCGKVAADLRLTSLWRGRLEIANLKLTDDALPPSLNLVYAKGHWNLESLLLRVEQVPSAPTTKFRSEHRPRFPYIEASGGRINLKIGPEKKPWAITNTDFAFWLASEDQWHVRLEGRPVRTDMNLSDTGTVKLEGDLRRSPALSNTPVKLEIDWEKAQLGQFSSLVAGHDPGWRGALSGSAQLSGTLDNLHVVASADLREFRRFDINRNSMPQVRTRCLGDYARGLLDLKCDTPLEPGGVVMTFRWSEAMPNDYDLSAVATRVPLAFLAKLARHARPSLPDDLTASGDLNAAFGFHWHNAARNWHGTGTTSPFLLQTAVAGKPFPVSAVRFHVGPPDTVPVMSKKGRGKQPEEPAKPNVLTIETFSVQLGPSTTLEVQGTSEGKGYWIGAKGMVPLERLLTLGQVAGFPTDISNTTASAVVNLNIAGVWTNFAAPKIAGTAHLQNAAAWIPGVKDRLLISEADVQISEIETVLAHIKAQFEHTPVVFSGTVSQPWVCQAAPPCPLEFDLHADTMALGDAAGLFGAGDKSWNLPFFTDSSSKLPEFRAAGSFSAGQLLAAELPLENFKAHVQLNNKTLEITKISARLAGGTVEGEWRADWSAATPRFSASGTLANVAMEKINSQEPDVALATSWITGRTDLKYTAKFEGASPKDMLSSAGAHIEFTVNNGSSRVLLLDGSKPLKFQSFQGALELEKQTLKVLPCKFRAETRIYDLSGTVSLQDKQARLRLSNSGSRWEITGALEKPQIAPQQPAAQTAAARTK